LKRKIEFLGYIVSKVTLNPRHTEAIKNYKQPANAMEVQRFLGLACYFRKFIKDFALSPFAKKRSVWIWYRVCMCIWHAQKGSLLRNRFWVCIIPPPILSCTQMLARRVQVQCFFKNRITVHGR